MNLPSVLQPISARYDAAAPTLRLQRAACDAFGVVVNVITSDAENW